MADFSTQVQEVAGAQGVRPQAPVATPSAVGPTVDIISKVGGAALGAFLNSEVQQRDVDRQKAVNSNLESFSQQQLKLATAVDTGQMSSAEARMRQRANYTAAIANNPSLIGQFADIQKSLTTTAGLAKNVADGTDAEQMDLANQKSASAAGWIPPTATPEQRTQATNEYLRYQRSQEQLSSATKQLAYTRSQIGLQTDRIQQSSALVSLQSAKIGLQEKQQEQTANIALGNLTDSYSSKFSSNLQQIAQDVQSGKITQEEGLQRADAQHQTVMQVASQVGQNAASGRLGALTAPMTEMYNNYKDKMSGKITQELLDRNITLAEGKQKMLILSDDDSARVVATSQLLGAAGPALMPAMSQQVVKILGKNMDPTTAPANPHPDTPTEKADNRVYLNTVKAGLTQLNSGGLNNNQAAKEEVALHANQVLKGVNAYSMAASDPTNYNDVVNFLASPEYGKFAATQGGVPADTAVQAKQVLQQQYEQAVVPLLKKEYDTATVNTPSSTGPRSTTGGLNSVAATSAIKPQFTGSGIVFMVDPTASNRSDAVLKAKGLNDRVAPILNNLIRMSAHLGGNQNYEKAYKDNYASIFGAEEKTGE